MKLSAYFIILILISSFVNAQIENYDPDDVKELYNKYEDKIPDFAKKLFGNERINIHIKYYKDFYLITEDAKLLDVNEGSLDNPTLNVYTDKETADVIVTGKLSLKEALDEGLVSYEAVGLWSKLKFGMFSGFVIINFS